MLHLVKDSTGVILVVMGLDGCVDKQKQIILDTIYKLGYARTDVLGIDDIDKLASELNHDFHIMGFREVEWGPAAEVKQIIKDSKRLMDKEII